MKRKSLESLAHEAMRRPHKAFVRDNGGVEDTFTNGYAWGFVAGFKLAAKRAARQRKPTPAAPSPGRLTPPR